MFVNYLHTLTVLFSLLTAKNVPAMVKTNFGPITEKGKGMIQKGTRHGHGHCVSLMPDWVLVFITSIES